jgi:exosortase C (VPDSG-CTERM-specific)
VAGLGLALGYLLAARAGLRLSVNDYLAWVVFSFVCCVAGAAFFCFGTALMRKVAFPACFAVFLVPFPEVWNNFWEMFFQHASAEAANLLFVVSGTPTFRHGLIFGLPGITIEVAQECSGTRSSFVLLLTGLLAGHLFLRTRWKKALLAAAIVPIGIARNALRIFSIAMLCVHIEPGMINSFIHKRGGPFFFVVSLVPFFALLLWFRKSESRPTKPGSDKPKH